MQLWNRYLAERVDAVRGFPPASETHESINAVFERALSTMHKMPRIWERYLSFLTSQKRITNTRRAFDRALCSLPITLHSRIWKLYLAFVRQDGMPLQTTLRVYRRYLKLEPAHAEEFIELLKQREQWNEAARRLADIVSDDSFVSLAGKSKHQLWLELCELVTKHPADVHSLPVERIIRGGIRKFTSEVGRLWTALADYFIRQGQFERARDVYDEALASVVTVRDFSMVYDALTQFEESMVSVKLEQQQQEESAKKEKDGDAERFLLDDDGDDVDLRLARLEQLTEQRPELLSNVKLRQNPHNVFEWLRRVHLFEDDPKKQIVTYTEAVKTIDPHKATGKLPDLWTNFAKLYENHGDLANAQGVFEKASNASFRRSSDLATVYLEWAEMLLRHNKNEDARQLLRKATTPSKPKQDKTHADDSRSVETHALLYKNVKLWHLLCDLEESIGSLDSAKSVYERALDLKVATPQTVLNYAHFMRERNYHEEAFRIYERGVSAFGFPHAKDIWQAYLSHFVHRYGGKKLERARELFEQATAAAPASEKKQFFFGLAKLEEDHGLAKRAMNAYSRAAMSVPQDQVLEVVRLYVSKATEFFGISKVRQVYEEFIQSQRVSNEQSKQLCNDYAELERQLGEIDRARALLSYASQFANPADDPEFWETWRSFEVKHGNEATFREMLRIKRSVAALYSKIHFNMQTVTVPAEEMQPKQKQGEQSKPEQDQNHPTQQGQNGVGDSGAITGFTSAGRTGTSEAADGETRHAEASANPEELDIGIGEEAQAAGEAMDVQEKGVPEDVYGGLKQVAEAEREGGQTGRMGALERFKRQRTQ